MRQGRRPGDRRVRVERLASQVFRVRRDSAVRRPPPPPAVVLVSGFAVLIAAGTVLLILPLASADGSWTRPLDALFIATSAVCVTGLVVVDTGTYWSPFGQVAILALIQVGGFGFMTGSTLLLLVLAGRRTGLRDRILAQASTGVADLGSVRPVLRRIALFTVLVEGIGALVLAFAFLRAEGDPSRAAWHGLFHSVSAFNNAGFDLTGGFRSLAPFAGDPLVLAPIAVLVLLGGLGYAIVGDALAKRRWLRFALETKLVLATSAVLVLGGAVALYALEWSNPATLGALPAPQRPFNALFESIAFRSAGFSAIPIGSLTDASLLLAIALMFIGGAAGSTAGGIKVTTFAILLSTVASTVAGRPFTQAFGRRVDPAVVARAVSIALLAVVLVFTVTLALELSGTDASAIRLGFEAVSAFGTVGHTTGITPSLPDVARVVLVVVMFAGRLGPLTLVLALSARARPVAYRPAVETIRIG